MLIGLVHLHSTLRWIIVLVVLYAVVRFVIIATRGTSFSKWDQKLMPSVAWLMTGQFVLGLILFITYLAKGMGLQIPHLEHGVTMLLALGAAHMAGKWKTAPPKNRAKNYLILLAILGILVFVGIARLPQGWLG